MGDPSTGSDAQRLSALVDEALKKWREALLDLSRRNRLLSFKPNEASALHLVIPDVDTAVGQLASERTIMIVPGVIEDDDPPAPTARQHLAAKTDAGWTNLTKAHRNLKSRAMTHYMDTGLHVLYLSVGMLQWVDADDQERRSPLLLIPVAFTQGTGVNEVVIESAPEDPTVNPALKLKLLDQAGVELPDLDDNVLTADSYSTLARKTRHAIRDQHGWALSDDMWVTYFAASKEAMYRDLVDHADLIAEHAQVGALAASGTDLGEKFHLGDLLDDLAPDRLDTTRPPEAHPTVLDADASQRAVIAAAVDGNSLVVAGPPGTGKSQTIANMIGGLLFTGKSVLFVSEKAAALEVVHNRLRQVGLAPYVLELHSHKATRAAVSEALATALRQFPAPPAGMPPVKRQTVRTKREQLNSYALAMNETRQPLGMSLLTVMGDAALLHELPAPDPAVHLAQTLDPNVLAVTAGAAEQLSRAWRPAQQGREFLWRGVTHTGTLAPRLGDAQRALANLRESMHTNGDLLAAFSWRAPSDAAVLAATLTHVTQPIPAPAPDQWWTATDPTAIPAALDALQADIHRITEARQAFTELTGVTPEGLDDIPAVTMGPLDDLAAVFAVPSPADVTTDTVTSMTATVAALAAETRKVSAAAEDVSSILQLPPPDTADRVSTLLRILSYADTAARLEPAWLTPDGAAAAIAAVTALTDANNRLDQARTAASVYFTDRCLAHDIPSLQSRFTNVHRGLFGKLSGDYRSDKRLVAEFNNPGLDAKSTIPHLGLAADWQEAAQHLADTEHRYEAILGAHYAQQHTDWGTLNVCLTQAQDIAATYPISDLTTLASVLNGQTPNVTPRLGTLRIELATHLHAFQQTTVQRCLWPLTLPWTSIPFTDLTTTLDTASNHLRAITATLTPLDAATGNPWNLTTAIDVLHDRDAIADLTRRFDDQAPAFQSVLHDQYQGVTTNIPIARNTWQWVLDTRQITNDGQPLTPSQVRAVEHVIPIDVAALATAWDNAKTAVLDAFDPSRHADLSSDLDDFDDGDDLINALLSDPDGQEEWFTYRAARDVLDRHGVGNIVDFSIANDVPRDRVPDLVRKAILTGWIDHHLATDERLKPFRLNDREAIVEEYRDLDQELVNTAIADILHACKAHRPHAHGDQVAVINAEGNKKRRHMPVRDLIAQSRDVTLAIKPCFMMSPMSVSQYLPPDIQFDVVIFDEASQVKPADAINSIYRGRELIIVGDDKQMPPTSFYDAVIDGGDGTWVEGQSTATDYESILTLASGSAAFDTLTLNTHYRSRHEDLIAFSNYSFYRGELHTFPSASITTNDLGVGFFHVPDGQYQRGTTRDNPREAQAVIQRLFHHYDTRPGLTVGLVAFSQAQATALELALDEALKERPDLRDHIESANRLDGFFIKNLETVQGDERDVIIFSVGYGPDEHGKITNTFGPLNNEGGERRLNVAVTRARNRVELVSSIHASDIRDTSNENVRHFRRYLDYAERGPAALAFDDGQSYGDPESPFEESIIATLRSWGYDIESQVGTAGYRIDIGVRHPDNPHTFMLGIEADGYAYHSAKTARDRDRIRHSILTGLGWRLHHIWGTSWYRHRDNAEEALRQALHEAQYGTPAHTDNEPHAHTPFETQFEEVDFDAHPTWVQEYTITPRPKIPYFAITEPGARAHLLRQVASIVQTESPIHRGLLYERLRDWWSIGRVGNRIRQAIDQAVHQPGVSTDGDFLLYPAHVGNPRLVPVRAPIPDTIRTIDQVHDSELSNAITQYVRDSRGISATDLKQRIARLFGWTRTGSNISERIDDLIDELIDARDIDGDFDRLTTQPSKSA